MIRAGVYGASGYIGGELLRLLLGHPDVEIVSAVSTTRARRRVDSVHPNLRGSTDLCFCAPEDIGDCDVIFTAVSPSVAMELVPQIAHRTRVLIDLSGGFRLRDRAEFTRYYGEHNCPELLGEFVTGRPETHRKELTEADRISVPGCMANAATLALHPLAAEGLIRPEVTIDGRVGSSGSGVTADIMNLHAERSGAMRVFKPQRHRHEAEVAQSTGLTVRMSATGVEAVRGVQTLIRVSAADGARLDDRELRRLYRDYYGGEPFVRIVAQKRGLYRLPEPKILIGSNYCDIGFSTDPEDGTAVLVAALDNLVKGGSGNAVQAMNIRFGLPETLGLGFPGLHPV
ncbi:N-acetyl-gamma-glutamyl-phosphate reductase [Streptomyces triticagri]|uniref:N-acetyl-gamma-glutamyl-phosphate reductase n=1 Tax=Streptomyces triticagri TaxID=2293568 RepID=A0A372LZG1_9ACTN|nr:N-acetyl-gamma-glutamyl-phosphate reductase [Streptomyces triticagri]RFU83417.1 N-acetyl-gamma-glutamyl-phosphate reductase [Streptomyces triticagri]